MPIVTSARDLDPFSTGSDGVAQVTGQVYNAASDVAGQPLEFKVGGPAVNYNNGQSAGVIEGSAKFVFVTMDGTINAWRSGTNPGMLEAVVVKDYSLIQPAAQGLRVAPGYTGVAMTTDAWRLDAQGQKLADNRLYAADFANGRIQTFDNQWQDVTAAGSFARPEGLAASYHPFNVQVMGDRVYVAWAENSFEIDEPTEEIPGAGFGRIAAYDRDGRLLQDFSDHSLLNAPWGMAIAPQSFGAFAGALLVANFGDGTIAGYDAHTGASLGYLRDAQGEVISIDGIWGLTFGNGVALGDANALYFTAGPDEERDGLLGKLELAPVPEPGTVVLMSLGLLGLLGRRGLQARRRSRQA